MEYDITIVCSTNDFYLGEALCRKVEQQGKRCLFNWRDAKNPLKLKMPFIDKSPKFVVIINNEAFKDNDFKLVASLQDKRNTNVYLLVNDNNVEIPNELKKATVIDASEGLTLDILDQLGIATSATIREVNVVEPLSVQQTDKEKKQSKNNTVTPTNQTASTSEQEKPVITPKQEKKPNNTVNNKHSEDWKTVSRNRIAKLRTVMTAAPTMEDEFEWTNQSRKDLVGEAYMVPLYVLPFERAEKVPFLNDLFKSIPEPGMTLMRAFRYLTGEGVPKDEQRAFTLAQKAVAENQEDGVALYCLGTFYENGIGTKTDFVKAKELYAKATDSGIGAAKTRLAAMAHQTGEDIEPITKLLNEARNEGDIEASYQLGIIAEDNGNFADAYEFYSEAAEMGHAKAQNAIATMHYNGTYVAQDFAQAEQWCNLSADQGFEGARYNKVIQQLNKIDKSRPNDDFLSDIICQYKSIKISATRYSTFLAAHYNIGILCRRSCADLDTVDSWVGGEILREVIPYANEFYVKLAEEEARIKRKAAGISVLNGINNLLAGLSGETRTNAPGGLFDNNPKDLLGRGK